MRDKYYEDNFGTFASLIAFIFYMMICLSFRFSEYTMLSGLICCIIGELLLASQMIICSNEFYLLHIFFLLMWFGGLTYDHVIAYVGPSELNRNEEDSNDT